jgi:hypothetical protein
MSNDEVRRLSLLLQQASERNTELAISTQEERDRLVRDLRALSQFEMAARQHAERELESTLESERSCRHECAILRDQLDNAKHGCLPSDWPTVRQARVLLQQVVDRAHAREHAAAVAHQASSARIREGVLALNGELGELAVLLKRERYTTQLLGEQLESCQAALRAEREASAARIKELEVCAAAAAAAAAAVAAAASTSPPSLGCRSCPELQSLLFCPEL